MATENERWPAQAERDGAPGRARSRRDRDRDRIRELGGRAEAFVMYFRERIYATFTGLAIVLVVRSAAHPEEVHAVLALLLGVVGITVAGFVADIIAHLVVHQELPQARDVAILLRVAGGALGTVFVPGLLLVLAWLGVLRIDAALTASTVVYIATLVVVGWLAVRRSKLSWWKQLLVLAVLTALGFSVIGIQALAKLA